MALTDYAIELADDWLQPHGIAIASPRDARRRGAHVALARADAEQLCELLATRGVLADYRAPDVVRAGLSPLTTSFADVYDGLAALRELSA